MRGGPRDVLGVGECAGRAEIVAAYRRLAMRWHPDRNSSPQATERFQEIQRAYRTLQTHCAPRDVRALWEEMIARDGEYAREIDDVRLGRFDNFPLVAAAWLLCGAAGFALAAYPGDWILLSLSLAAANAAYKTGDTRRALRIESAFRLASRLYWLVLLCAAVWFLARRVFDA